jgi:hypothetical protein
MLTFTHFAIIMTGLGIGEYFNCMYPRIEDGYSSEGYVCNWEEDDFYSINGQYILALEDSTDNCFEAKARKRYWENK